MTVDIKENKDKSINELLDNPTTFKIFLYLRMHRDKFISTRQAQRDMEIKSPSTVTWHLNKLCDAGYVEKNSANQYHLTNKGIFVSKIQAPINTTLQFVQNVLISQKIFLLAFMLISIIIAIVLLFQSLLWCSIFLLFSLLVATLAIIKDYKDTNRQLSIALEDTDTLLI